jgi:hypothetical protein
MSQKRVATPQSLGTKKEPLQLENSNFTCCFYEYENWSHTLREGHRLRVFENRMLRTIFGPTKDEVAGGWGRLYNEELQNLYASPNVIRVIRSRWIKWMVHVAHMGEMRNVYKTLVRKLETTRKT